MTAIAMDTTLPAPRAFREIPVWPTRRPLGHLNTLRRDALGMFTTARRRYGDLVRLRMGHRTILLVLHPDLVHHVLVEHADNYTKATRGYSLLRSLLGTGLLTSEGEVWRTRRRLAQPGFHKQRIAGFAEAMRQATDELAARWDGRLGTDVDVAEEMNALALEIACTTLFGTGAAQRTAVVGQALTDALAAFEQLVTVPSLVAPEKLPLLPATRRFFRAQRTLHDVVDGIIAERRRAGDDRDDLLGMFMAARDDDGTALDDVALRDELLTMMLAAHETTANALTWTFYLLSTHPGAARRMRAELVDVLGDRAVQLGDLAALPRTDHVLKESLRLYPPAWSISRAAVADDVLGGYRVPAGTYVFTSPWTVHRHPDLWRNPEGFDPDRWAEPPRDRLAWYPFGAGRRKCIGEPFALMEARIVLATLVRRFRLDLVPGARIVPEPSVTLRPRYGMPMTVHAP